MSTPSTITATLPPPHSSRYGYSNHNPYQASPHYADMMSARDGYSNGTSRLPQSYNAYPNNNSASISRTSTVSRQPPPPQSLPVSQPSPALPQGIKREREREPDWNEFYKNGVPKEIIVIDDDSPPPPKNMPPKRVENERPYEPQRAAQRTDTFEHAAKKRRTGQGGGYQPEQFQQPVYSHQSSSHGGSSGHNTVSTDRTTSLQTTAPTSLGSHTSQGSVGAYLEEGAVGQKRKRVTRQQVADEKKRKDIEIIGEAYAAYVPPPKPPIKAKELHVPAVKDVCYFLTCSLEPANLDQRLEPWATKLTTTMDITS